MKKTFFDTPAFRWTVVLAVTAAAVAGLIVAGSPAQERARRLDDQRVQDLQQISYAVDQFNGQNNRLPASLTELNASQTYVAPGVMTDLETNQPFEYDVMASSSYQLCATFDTASSGAGPAMPKAPYPVGTTAPGFWNHPAGHTCFALRVTPVPTPKP